MTKQTGSVIVYTILILGTVMTITLTLVRIFLPKLKVARDSINSTGAIYAADSATEICLYEARTGANIAPRPSPSPSLLTNGETFTIASLSATPVIITNNCLPLGPATFSFRAIGEFNGVDRAIEIHQ